VTAIVGRHPKNGTLYGYHGRGGVLEAFLAIEK
jgi:hypothetical protein